MTEDQRQQIAAAYRVYQEAKANMARIDAQSALMYANQPYGAHDRLSMKVKAELDEAGKAYDAAVSQCQIEAISK